MTIVSPRLNAFVCVAEEGSLGRAAAALNVSQPALSRLIRSLEDEVGVQLYERRTTGMELTVYGQSFLPYAKLLKLEAGRAVEELRVLQGNGRGQVRVGAVRSALTSPLPAAVAALRSRFPGLHIEIFEATEEMIARALIGREIDIALAGPIIEGDQIARLGDARFEDQCALVAAPGHPLHELPPPSRGDGLLGEWVLPPVDAPPRQLFEKCLRANGFKPIQISVETRSVAALKAMAMHAGLVTWGPLPIFAAELEGGLLKRLWPGTLHLRRTLHVYRRSGCVLPPGAMSLAHELARLSRAGGEEVPEPSPSAVVPC